MRPKVRLLLALSAVTLVATMPVRAEAPTVRDRFRKTLTDAAARAGVGAEDLLARPITVSIHDRGELRTTTVSLGDLIEQVAPDAPDVPLAASGPLGTPEYVAGNITHGFVTAWSGPSSQAASNCQSVTVSRSQTIPDTAAVASAAGYPAPIVPVTGAPLYATPVPGALSPVVPASSWALPVYVWLGPTYHIKARYTSGVHQVGTLIGSSVSTASGAPSPWPVWAPMTTNAFLADHSIDFLGQGLFLHAEFSVSLLGQTFCGGAGALALSNGAAIFDNHPVLGTTIALPEVP